ncbi:DUF6011 domain-containing protein [Streptomyces sp. SP18CS02]|uniref:DUF6011 domain-containing protein n=1 Tax=Streptomyces sp. SP18CS02 TaxID=3002531 RepID=UPI002E79F68B|nr:DUF6011 domain-containing protein [Streptomyces sp. SP18CS02]MEE1752692.1 DUF6011 domain-containing protein [Streptomyces sp. SP18CS02]
MPRRHVPHRPALLDDPVTGYRHRYCRRCGRELTSPESRLTGYGPTCDPSRRPPPTPEHVVDQEPLPGT